MPVDLLTIAGFHHFKVDLYVTGAPKMRIGLFMSPPQETKVQSPKSNEQKY